jgi:hypothetical protein
MKTPWLPHSVILCVGALMLLTSCEYPYYPHGGYYGAGPNQRAGTLYGAAGGALLGGIIGNQSRRPLQGALIGGVTAITRSAVARFTAGSIIRRPTIAARPM